MLKKLMLLPIFLTILVSGCAGYQNKVDLPYDVTTIYVPTVKNQIPIERMQIYIPGMEVDITNAVINRLIFDGTFKVVNREEDADATLNIYLRNFYQEGTRFSNLETVEEYRLFVECMLDLVDNQTGKKLVAEDVFRGKTSYFRQSSEVQKRSGKEGASREPIALPLSTATEAAILDFAHNVVDLITEAW